MAITNFVKNIRNIMRNDAGINGDAQRIEQIAWMLFLKVYDEKENDWEFNEDNYTSFIPENCRWRNWAKDDGTGEALTADKLLDFVNNTLFPTLKELEVTPDTPMRSAIVRATFQDANQYMKDGVLLRQVLNVIDGLDLSSYEESHAFGEIYETILKEMQSAGTAGEFYTPRALTDFMAEIIQPKIGEKVADFACGTGGFLTSWLKALDKKVNTAEDREAFVKSIYGIEKKQFPYMLCVTNMLLHDIDSPKVFHGNSLTKDVLNYTDDDKFDVILMNPPYGGNEKNDVKRHFPSDLASSETADLFMVVIQYRLAKNGRAAVKCQVGYQGETVARVQSAYHHPSARQHLCPIYFDCHQYSVLQQREGRGCSRGIQYEGYLVLSYGYARGLQAFLEDQAHAGGSLQADGGVVEQPRGDHR